jgi:hypothetical protein
MAVDAASDTLWVASSAAPFRAIRNPAEPAPPGSRS